MEIYMGLVIPSALTYAPVDTLYCNGQLLNVQTNAALFSLLGTNFGGNGSTNFGIPDLRARVPVGITLGANLYGLNVALGNATTNSPNVVLTLNNLPPHNHAAIFNATTGPAPISITVGSGGTGLNAAVPALTVNGSLSVSTAAAAAAATSSTPSATNVPASIPQIPFSATQGGNKSVYAYGPATAPNTASWAVGGTTSTASAPVNGTISGNANTVTGGTVAIGNTGSGMPFTTMPPYLGLAYLIITQGIYPPRP